MLFWYSGTTAAVRATTKCQKLSKNGAQDFAKAMILRKAETLIFLFQDAPVSELG
jgi:hypothetical protein